MDSGLIVPFGRYVLKERLAQGGMGEVFRAVAVGEHGFEKPVVVKRILPAHAGREDLTELFVAEAKLMTRLSHPNIVEVLDFGRGEHKDYYLVLELVDGTDLGRLTRAFSTRGEPFPVPLALFITAQVLRGLHHAHTKSTFGSAQGTVIVHRDVSPSNVLCSAEGEVKVADFGVALVTQLGSGRGSAGVAGKPGYMAPEQIDGAAVDARADVFSAAVVLQQMLTGELPFPGATPEDQQAAMRRGERTLCSARRGDVSDAVEAILERALSPAPDARFPDAKAMAQAIERLRDAGQRLAGSDDLAEAVQAAQRELPAAGRRVIALTGASVQPGGPGDPGPESEDAPRELTRTGAPGAVGAFTLRFPVRADATTRQRDDGTEPAAREPDRWSLPEPRTERIAPGERAPDPPDPPAAGPGPGAEQGTGPFAAPHVPEPAEPPDPAEDPAEDPRRRLLRRGAIAAVLAAALLGVVAFVVRTPRAASQAGSATTQATMATTAPATAAPSEAPPAPETAAPVTTATPAPHPAVRSVALRGAPTVGGAPSVGAAPTVSASASPAPPPEDACAGDVAFHSTESWNITGGPHAVQSPSPPVTWPCGTYTLTARSRLDPAHVTSRTVTVGAKLHAVVDLR